jgi:hypothetical protein
VFTRVGEEVQRTSVRVAPHDIVLGIQRDATGVSPESRRSRECDPPFHTHIRSRGFITSKRMLVACVRPPLKVQPKENKRVQKLKKIWKIQKQMKKEEKDLFRELWEERLRPVEYDMDFDDLFDSF